MADGQRLRRKKIGVLAEKSKFTEENLFELAKMVQNSKVPLPWMRASDDMVSGLRAKAYKSGLITFHASYEVGEKRPFIALGHLNKDADDHISLEDARELTKIIKALGHKGIDVADGLQKRLIRELKEKGTTWRPGK